MQPDERQAPRRLYRVFPFLDWLKNYQLGTFKDEAIAGITIAVVLIPQAMAYAMLAGMPAVYGLYAAAVTPFIAALWGSLRQLATGPIAIMSLLVLTTLSSMAEPGSPEFIELAFLLAMMVGILYFLIGIFKMGIVMVSFPETYSVGKAIASQTKQKVNVDQEFIGQGRANFIGSFFQCYPVSGSFSRTAINYAAGGKAGPVVPRSFSFARIIPYSLQTPSTPSITSSNAWTSTPRP